ncbi:hypothetical protein HYV79_04845 [Candidatus Woesearchaeota archaeon]|nr:hypothetical protein [Candidatus Woesearchaeota archaeon]
MAYNAFGGLCGQMMGGAWPWYWLLANLLLIGLVIVVFLWAWKLWKEVSKKLK